MRTAKSIQTDIYESYLADQSLREDTRVKKSFWASDCLKPINELYWSWMGVPKTNKVSPEKMAMFDVAKLCELHLTRKLAAVGIGADLDNEEHVKQVEAATGRKLTFAEEPDDFGQRQLRVEMEREFVPVTGYMDGITLNGEPIEIKSTRSTKYLRDVATGRPPQVEHVFQLAVYMDFIGAKVGWLAVWERAGGAVFFVKVEHLGDLIYATTDHSIGLPEEMRSDNAPAQTFEVQQLTIDLGAEYKRWRKLYEDNIHPRKEPALEFEYRPEITPEFLANYMTQDGKHDKIRKAIKGERILSDHRWKVHYCDWKDLWIQKEMEIKGFTDMEKFCTYTDDEIGIMMDVCNVEWRVVKTGKSIGTRRLFKRKGK